MNVDSLGLVGMDCTEAKAKAEDNGLTNVSCEAGEAAPSADKVNTVYRYEPQANVDFDEDFTLSYYGAQTTLPDPSAARIQIGGQTVSEVEQGSTVQVVTATPARPGPVRSRGTH